jgi:hydrogenase maturation factor
MAVDAEQADAIMKELIEKNIEAAKIGVFTIQNPGKITVY